MAGRAVRSDEELRHEEHGNAPGSGRGVGKPCQHEMDDIPGEIVVAVGDEDLLAGDAVAAVGGALGLVVRAPRSEPACGSVRFMVAIQVPETSFGR